MRIVGLSLSNKKGLHLKAFDINEPSINDVRSALRDHDNRQKQLKRLRIKQTLQRIKQQIFS